MNQNLNEKRFDAIAYMPGLDGLRALAVAAVFAYHLGFSYVPGGFLGVDLFFVLSGFLITGILLKQSDTSGYLDLKDFWVRRARRLLPALLLMLGGVTGWLYFFSPERFEMFLPEIPAAMLYYSNWRLIFNEVSYFELFGPPSPFGHLWSLAIEGQFYLLWPVAFGVFICFFGKRLTALMIFTAILASVIAMELLYIPGGDPIRVYYGTDTRAFALLTGALLSMYLNKKIMPKTLPLSKRLALDVLGFAGLTVVLLMIFKVNQYHSFTYQGGLLLFSVAAACLVAVLAHPASCFGKLFSFKPLRWIGECSYGIYLWHFPVIVLTSPPVNTSGLNLSLSLFQIALTVTLAAFSRYFVEEPIRCGKRYFLAPPKAAHRFAVVSITLFLVLFAATGESEQPYAIDHIDIIPVPIPTEEIIEAENIVEIEEPVVITGDMITVIGDSLMVGVEPYLTECLPGITVDAKVSRQMRQAPEVLENLKLTGGLKEIVVIELGTNGPFTERQLVDLLDYLKESDKIIFLNARVPKHWEATVNETLAGLLKFYPRTVLIDWYSESRGRDEFFYSDGVHLRPVGADFYCSLILDAL